MAGESSRTPPGGVLASPATLPHINWETDLGCLVSVKPLEQLVSQDQLCPGIQVLR